LVKRKTKIENIERWNPSTPFSVREILETQHGTTVLTGRARLYQDILLYLNDAERQPIKFYSLVEWLVTKKNIDLKNHYSGSNYTRTNKIINASDTIETCVSHLKSIGLMYDAEGIKSKNPLRPAKAYGYSVYGKILALLIPYFDNKQSDERWKNKIFELIQESYAFYGSYLADFMAALYKNASELGLGHSVIEALYEEIKSGSSKDLREVLNRTILVTFAKKHPKFKNMYLTTLNSLDVKARKAVMLHHKLAIEKEIYTLPPPKIWEDVWIAQSEDPSRLVLFGICSKCNLSAPILVSYQDYILRLRADDSLIGDCPKCHTVNALKVLDHIPKQD